MEFLVEVNTTHPERIRGLCGHPPGEDAQAYVDDVMERELAIGPDLKKNGVKRTWELVGRYAVLLLWEAPDAAALHKQLLELPLFPWMDIKVTPLAPHWMDAL
jgi:muconolactone D-isomerase